MWRGLIPAELQAICSFTCVFNKNVSSFPLKAFHQTKFYFSNYENLTPLHFVILCYVTERNNQGLFFVPFHTSHLCLLFHTNPISSLHFQQHFATTSAQTQVCQLMGSALVRAFSWAVPSHSCARRASLRPTARKPSLAFSRMATWCGIMQFLAVKVSSGVVTLCDTHPTMGFWKFVT